MPFAVKRVSDGAYATRGRTFEADPEKVRLFSTASAAAGSLRYMHTGASKDEHLAVEVVEVQWREVATKSRYVLDCRGYRPKAKKVGSGPDQGSFRHVD